MDRGKRNRETGVTGETGGAGGAGQKRQKTIVEEQYVTGEFETAEKPVEERPRQLSSIWHKVSRVRSLQLNGRLYGAVKFELKDLTQGVSAAFLREGQLWIRIEERPPQRRVGPAAIIHLDDDENSSILWENERRCPKLCDSYSACPEQAKRAWLYQVVKVMQAFHDKNRQFRNIILPWDLLHGNYASKAKEFLNESENTEVPEIFVAPNQMCLFANDLMRLGSFFPKGRCSLLTHKSPEELLGDLSQSPEKDLWMLAHLIHDLYEEKALIHDDETDSRFAHLMKIFKKLGTPKEANWEGVSKLPYFNQQYPQWEMKDLKESLSDKIPQDAKSLIASLLKLNPRERISAKAALEHPYFSDIHKIESSSGNSNENESLEVNGEFNMIKNFEMLRKEESKHSSSAMQEMKEGVRMEVDDSNQKESSGQKTYSNQKEIDGQKRQLLVDWLAYLCQVKELSQDTLFVGIQLLDDYINRQKDIPLSDFQLLGEVCVFIASKTVDCVRLTLDELADIPDEFYDVRQVRQMECKVLQKVGIKNIQIPNALYFLRTIFALFYNNSAEGSTTKERLAEWLCALMLIHVHTRKYKASIVATSAAILAVKGEASGDVKEISSDFQKIVNIVGKEDRDQLKDCIVELKERWEEYACGPRGDDFKSKNRLGKLYWNPKEKPCYVWKKYFSPEYESVSRLQPVDIQKQNKTRAQTDAKDPASVLSCNEILHLLKFLDKPEMCLLSSVSKRWQAICGSRDLSRGEWNLRRHKEMINSQTIVPLVERLKDARELNLFRCKLTAASVHLILRKCPNLRKLDLSYTVCDGPREPDVIDLTREPTAMKELRWQEESKSTMYPPLEELNLRKSEVVDEDLKEEGVIKILRGCQHLKSLNLGMLNCVGTQVIETIEGDNISKNLEELHLNSCPNVTNADLQRLAKACRKLKRLFLDMCSKITDDGITAIAKGCNLEELSLCANRVSDRSLSAIAKNCKDLYRLELSFCYLVSTDGVVEIAEGCRNIKLLNLCLVDMIQDNAIEKLAQFCKLEELNLRGCTHITDNALKALQEHCRHLKVLHLLGCEKVSASTVAILKQRIPHVKIIIW